MDCPVCIEALEDRVTVCFPCGHFCCLDCTNNLQKSGIPHNSRLVNSRLVCPSCRKPTPSKISPDNIRRVYLNIRPSCQSPQIRALEAKVQKIKKEHDKDLVQLRSCVRALDSKDTLLAFKDQELEQLKAQLSEAKAKIDTALLAKKDREISEGSKKCMDLTISYQEEFLANLQAQRQLRLKDVEIENLKELVERTSPQVPKSDTEWALPFLSVFKGTSLFSSSSGSDSRSQSTGTNTSRSTFAQSDQIPFNPSLSSASASLSPFRTNSPPITTITKAKPKPTTVTKAKPKPPKTRVKKVGNEILWRGYGCPQTTPVLECTASNGYHNFSGVGTNQYKKRYTCKICGECISENY